MCKKHGWVLGLVWWLWVCGGGCQRNKALVEPPTVLYFVRHAETVSDGTRNPPLSKVGYKRALALSRMLHSVPLHAVFATQYKRTQLTIAPTANAKRLSFKLYKAGAIKPLLKRLTSSYAGRAVLVAGHSNTIPLMLKGLGVPFTLKLDHKRDYDSLFVVIWRRGQVPVYQRFHFGPPSPQ